MGEAFLSCEVNMVCNEPFQHILAIYTLLFELFAQQELAAASHEILKRWL